MLGNGLVYPARQARLWIGLELGVELDSKKSLTDGFEPRTPLYKLELESTEPRRPDPVFFCFFAYVLGWGWGWAGRSVGWWGSGGIFDEQGMFRKGRIDWGGDRGRDVSAGVGFVVWDRGDFQI